jgi:hypothetical protein
MLQLIPSYFRFSWECLVLFGQLSNRSICKFESGFFALRLVVTHHITSRYVSFILSNLDLSFPKIFHTNFDNSLDTSNFNKFQTTLVEWREYIIRARNCNKEYNLEIKTALITKISKMAQYQQLQYECKIEKYRASPRFSGPVAVGREPETAACRRSRWAKASGEATRCRRHGALSSVAAASCHAAGALPPPASFSRRPNLHCLFSIRWE